MSPTRRSLLVSLLAFTLIFSMVLLSEIAFLDAEDRESHSRQQDDAVHSRPASLPASLCPVSPASTVQPSRLAPVQCPPLPTAAAAVEVLITGALTPYTAALAVQLTRRRGSARVTVALDYDVAAAHDDHMTWYYVGQLLKAEVELQWLNLRNETDMKKITEGKKFSHVVFTLACGQRLQSTSSWSRSLEHLVSILQAVKATPCARFVYIEHNCSASRQTGGEDPKQLLWQRVLHKVVSMYSMQGVRVMYVLLARVYGPWVLRSSQHGSDSCWFIDDVTSWMEKWLTGENVECQVIDLTGCPSSSSESDPGSKSCSYPEYRNGKLHHVSAACTASSKGLQEEKEWRQEYLSELESSQDVVFSTYFTSTVDPQRNNQRSPNQFAYMRNWYESVNRQGLRAVVFHDGLSPRFVSKLTNARVAFVEVASLKGRSTNDARFYLYQEYLRVHPEIGRVVLTDISDVVFQRNPFQLMSLLGDDHLYVGTDIDFFPDLHSMPWIATRFEGCFGTGAEHTGVGGGEVYRMMHQLSVFNAGVIGGSRAKVLAALCRITQSLDATPHHLNCNMPAVNYAIHRYFSDVVFTGFPLTSRFQQHQTSPKAVYIVHK